MRGSPQATRGGGSHQPRGWGCDWDSGWMLSSGMTLKIRRCFASWAGGRKGGLGRRHPPGARQPLACPHVPSDWAGLGATCLGSWESDGAFDAWVALRKNSEPWV